MCVCMTTDCTRLGMFAYSRAGRGEGGERGEGKSDVCGTLSPAGHTHATHIHARAYTWLVNAGSRTRSHMRLYHIDHQGVMGVKCNDHITCRSGREGAEQNEALNG